MTPQVHKNYPLQIAISTLFIAIMALLGLILSWHSYHKTSDIMLSNAVDIYERITQEFIFDFKATYGPMAGGLRQFRLSPVIKAKTFKERIAYLPEFQAVLESNPSVFVVGIAYQNGDYLGFTLANSNYVKQNYVVPTGANFMALYFQRSLSDSSSEPEIKPGKLYSIFYDNNLNELSRNAADGAQFDPHTRPWYQQATEQPSATKPYVYYDTDIVGLSAMTKTTQPGVVVAFAVTLENLSNTIARHFITPNSEVVLINAKGQTFAYKDQQKVFIKNTISADKEELQLANLKQLGSGVLNYLSNNIEVKEQNLDFEYNGQQWIGSTRIIAKPGGVDLYALIVSPVDELLVDAVAIRWQLINTALVVLLIFIPVIWFTAKKISKPMNSLAKQAEAISRFDFTETTGQVSFIKEVDKLGSAMALMKATINKFISLINSLAGEQDLDALLKSITTETMLISQADAVLVYLLDEKDDLFKADFLCDKQHKFKATDKLPQLTLEQATELFPANETKKSFVIELNKNSQNKLIPLLDLLVQETLTCIILPLQNRNNELIGLLCLIYQQGNAVNQVSNIEFIEALSGFAAVTLESRQLFNMQEELLNSFIKLIAGAIDTKSPYTGGHCQRVPEITLMLAKAACESEKSKFSEFTLDDKQWQELSIASWLHDCGKVIIPEYVVDKATKLETIYDRIHEVRMRFEVLKRDAEIDCWRKIAEGGNKEILLTQLGQLNLAIDNDFAFVAECNIGGEFMDDEKIKRLQTISEKTWMRTLDDKLGVSWEELGRKESKTTILPVKENILANKVEHIITRQQVDKLPQDNQWGFKVNTPEYKYNRGELYNLSIKRGTLTEEDRYMINAHMIQTIIMLNNLPFPKYLRNVPLIAGSHHETMDGKGYPKRLKMSEQPLTSRMMVIADIFEALTASDRPYKKAKSLNESIRILSFMRNDKHIDADLFDLFLTSGVYLEYAQKYLNPEQIDEVNIKDYLSLNI
ncbi:MAG: HD domain-containing phosphohydrolase [Thiohalomonadales bacterium]